MEYTTEDYYFASHNNVIDMCKDRKYTTNNNNDLTIFKKEKTEFLNNFENHENNHNVLDIMPFETSSQKTFMLDENKLPVYITFIESKRENKSFIKEIFKNIYDALKDTVELSKNNYVKEILNSLHVIILHNNDTTPGSQYSSNFELFPVRRHFINVTKHSIVPVHRLLSEEEKQAVFQSKNMTIATCPKIHTDDPVNLYYNGKLGNLYEIIRNGKAPYYRTVSHGPKGSQSPFSSQFNTIIKK